MGRSVAETPARLGGAHLVGKRAAARQGNSRQGLPAGFPQALQPAITHQSRLRVGAAVLLMLFGIYKLLHPRHPRYMARIGPTRLTLWSFLMATAHGAGLMLIPIFLVISSGAAGLDLGGHAGVPAFGTIAASGVGIALLSVLVHTLAMILTAGLIAWLVYRYLGLRLLQKAWFNLDFLWAAVLMVVGMIALVI